MNPALPICPQPGSEYGPEVGRAKVQESRPPSAAVGQWGNRREPERTVGRGVTRARSRPFAHGNLIFVRRHVGTAGPGVSDGSTLTDAGCERKTRAVSKSVGDLPAANDEVHRSSGVGQKSFSSADGQFVDRVRHEYLVTVIPVRSPCKLFVHGKIVVIVRVGVGERVVG